MSSRARNSFSFASVYECLEQRGMAARPNLQLQAQAYALCLVQTYQVHDAACHEFLGSDCQTAARNRRPGGLGREVYYYRVAAVYAALAPFMQKRKEEKKKKTVEFRIFFYTRNTPQTNLAKTIFIVILVFLYWV